MDNYIGKRLDGRYEILELIGAGGMANVYKANDRLENRIVAVKILRGEFLDNAELVRRFKNESKAIGMLSHTNIVKVYDVNFSDTVLYIVMEYIDGITLKDYIDRKKPLSWKDTIHFTTQVLRALQHAHDNGIIHRDIKPQNIMILSIGSIKVMDFGIARFSRSETRTITNKAIGSVHYISPEQARGEETDAKSDIYSVGIILYEMLTGKLPFESDSAVSVAMKQISDEAISPREIIPDIPEGLEEITMKAMSKDPAKRYQSASQMLRDIDEFKKNPSVVFAYKYFSGDNVPDMTDLNKNVAAATTASAPLSRIAKPSESPASSPNGAPRKVIKKRKRRIKHRNIFLWLVLGITLACVICTGIILSTAFGLFEGERESVDLPSFLNMEISKVKSEYSDRFKFKVFEEYSADKREGTVIDQRPYPPKTIKEGSTVSLYVSKGPEIVTIPDVIDMSSGEASKLLRSMGLSVKMLQSSDKDYGSNKVLYCEPAVYTSVQTGTEVTLYINVISVTVSSSTTVPNVVGMPYKEAIDALTKLALGKGLVETVDDPSPAGTVLSQSIPEGRRVSAGTRVNLTVSSGVVQNEYSIQCGLPYSVDGNTSFAVNIFINGQLNVGTTGSSNGSAGTTFRTDTDVVVDVKLGDSNSLFMSYAVNVADHSISVVTDNSGSFQMEAPKPKTVKVTLVVNNGSGSGSQDVPVGSDATFDAVQPAEGYTGGIADGCTYDETYKIAKVTNVQNEITVTVTFSKIEG